MPELPAASRRNFLTLAGAGIAAAGAAVALPHHDAGAASPAAVEAAVRSLPADAEKSIMAHVHDVHTGVVTVMVAGREVEITDRALVASLVHAASHSGL